MENLTNAPIPIVIDGREYLLTPPGLADWEFWLNAMRGEYIQANGNTPEIRREAFKSFGMLDLLGWFETPAGCTKLLYRLLVQKHPEVTIDECLKWILSGAARPAELAELAQASQSSSGDAAKKNGQQI